MMGMAGQGRQKDLQAGFNLQVGFTFIHVCIYIYIVLLDKQNVFRSESVD